MTQFTITKENEGRKGEAFVVRNENQSFQAAFAYHFDAQLYVTMVGCDSCMEEVSDHMRIKDEERDWHDCLRPEEETVYPPTLTGHCCSRQ